MRDECKCRYKERRAKRIKRRMKWRERLKKLLIIAKRIILSIFASSMAAMILIPAAMTERGYPAVGGEWIGIIFLGYIVFLASKKLEKENGNNDG